MAVAFAEFDLSRDVKQFKEGRAAVSKHFSGMHSSALGFGSNHLHTRADFWEGKGQACTDAFVAYADKMKAGTTCKTFLASLDEDQITGESPFGLLSESEQRTELAGFCPVCKDQILNDVVELMEACAPIPDEVKAGLGMIRTYLNILCLYDDSTATYCYPSLKGMDALNITGVPTTAQLDAVCSPCVAKMIAFLATFIPEQAKQIGALLGLLCLKDASTGTSIYCVPEFVRVIEMPDNTTAEVSAKLTAVCDTRCVAKVLNKARQFDAASYDAFPYEPICNRNEANQLCLPMVINEMAATNQDALCKDTTACTQNGCNVALQTFFTNTGCCGANFLALHVLGNDCTDCTGTPKENYAMFTGYLTEQCGVAGPITPCTGFVNLIKTYVFKNLLWSYYLAHKAEIDAWLAADVSGSAGVDETKITVTGSESGGRRRLLGESSTTFQVTIAADSAAIATAIEADLTSQGVSFVNTAQVPAAGKIDSTAALNEAPVVAGTTTGAISAASTVAVSAAVVVAALFAAAF